MKIENDIVARVIKSLRKQMTSSQLSKRLRYDFDKVYRWEKGLSRFYWRDFVAVAKLCKFDIQPALKNSFYYYGSPSRYDEILKHCIGQHSVALISAKTQLNRHKIGRWLSGDSEPTFIEMVSIFKKCAVGHSQFLSYLLAHQPLLDKIEREKSFHYKFPFIAAVVRFFDLTDYQSMPTHQRGYLAKKMHCSLKKEDELVQLLLEAGAVQSSRGGKLIAMNSNLNTGDRQRQLKLYWLRYALDFFSKIKHYPRDSQAGYLVFSVSSESFEHLKERYRKFYQEVYQIVHADDKADRVGLFQLQLIDLEEAIRSVPLSSRLEAQDGFLGDS